VRLDFISSLDVNNKVVEEYIGKQIFIFKIDKFNFLLENRINIKIKKKRNEYSIYCPKPSAFIYHKAATFVI